MVHIEYNRDQAWPTVNSVRMAQIRSVENWNHTNMTIIRIKVRINQTITIHKFLKLPSHSTLRIYTIDFIPLNSFWHSIQIDYSNVSDIMLLTTVTNIDEEVRNQPQFQINFIHNRLYFEIWKPDARSRNFNEIVIIIIFVPR